MPPFLIYLIIYGTRGVTYSAGEGQFHCPDCGRAPYRLRRVRRFFTLYFIPLIPLDVLGEYVECESCQGTYQLGVLSYNPAAQAAAFEAQFHIAVRRTMVLMCLADGLVEAEEVATIQRVFGRIAKREITEEEVYAEIAAAQTDGRPVQAFLAGGMAATLNNNGKEMVIRAAFMVAAADGEFQDQETELLAEIGNALQMTTAHFNGVIDSMLADGARA